MGHEKLDTYIAGLNLSYSAIFIPQSKSRNADKEDASLNWSVSISPNSGKDCIQRGITTDYMQGIGHAPGYEHVFKQSGHKDLYFAHVAEKGRTLKKLLKMGNGKIDWYEANNRMTGYGMGLKGTWNENLPSPALRDVLYSLVMDSDVINYNSFEDWAENFGYETDSRKAEKTYNDCMKIALKLRALIGDAALNELKKLFQDY